MPWRSFPWERSGSGRSRRGSLVREASCRRRSVCEWNDAAEKEKIMLTPLRATRHAAAGSRYSVRTASCVIGLIVSVLAIGVQADHATTFTYVAKSGLQTFFNRHVVRLTVVEAGAATVTSRAVIELRNRQGRVVARKEATLTPASPVQLDLKVDDTIQLRAIVTVITDSAELTAPLVTFED